MWRKNKKIKSVLINSGSVLLWIYENGYNDLILFIEFFFFLISSIFQFWPVQSIENFSVRFCAISVLMSSDEFGAVQFGAAESGFSEVFFTLSLYMNYQTLSMNFSFQYTLVFSALISSLLILPICNTMSLLIYKYKFFTLQFS